MPRVNFSHFTLLMLVNDYWKGMHFLDVCLYYRSSWLEEDYKVSEAKASFFTFYKLSNTFRDQKYERNFVCAESSNSATNV